MTVDHNDVTTPLDQIAPAVASARAFFNSGTTRPLAWRRAQLKSLDATLDRHQQRLTTALTADLGKHATESLLLEINVVRAEITHTLRHLRRWARGHRGSPPVPLLPARARVLPEPLGTVLIIAPWNYPIQLTLVPLVGAIAAGNTAVVKPSELAPRTAQALANLLADAMAPGAVQVIQGGVEVSTELLRQRFDHIVYTGGATVGRIVMHAAAEHLTPVTLELGGKSPAWFDDDAHIDIAAKRLAWASFTNAGQTCIAPDYVLTTPERVGALVAALRRATHSLYGEDARSSVDYARIVNERQFDRLAGYLTPDALGGGTVVVGGGHDREALFMEPTVVVMPQAGADAPAAGSQAAAGADASSGNAEPSPLLRDEIFGPILPIVPVASLDDAIAYVNAREKPLSLYVFSSRRAVRKAWERRTSSGAVSHNIGIVHASATGLPFGGVGASGMGAYHGVYSWRTFSHDKAVFSKPPRPDVVPLILPPYTRFTRWIAEHIGRLV